MSLRFLILLLAFTVFAGCATTSSDSRPTFAKPGTGEAEKISRHSLVGTWYGSQATRDGTTKEWISRRYPDGRFQGHFREKKDGRVIDESVEVGEWGLSFDFEIIITRGWLEDGDFHPAPPRAYFWDIYRVEQVDQDGMTYIHYGTGHRYQVRRVPDDLDFPEEPNQPVSQRRGANAPQRG